MNAPALGSGPAVPATETLEMRAQQARLQATRSRLADSQDADAARQFESLVLSMLVKEMRKTLPEGLFGETPGASVFEGLFDQMMGEELASGRGLGLADQLLADAARYQGPPASPEGEVPGAPGEPSERAVPARVAPSAEAPLGPAADSDA